MHCHCTLMNAHYVMHSLKYCTQTLGGNADIHQHAYESIMFCAYALTFVQCLGIKPSLPYVSQYKLSTAV